MDRHVSKHPRATQLHAQKNFKRSLSCDLLSVNLYTRVNCSMEIRFLSNGIRRKTRFCVITKFGNTKTAYLYYVVARRSFRRVRKILINAELVFISFPSLHVNNCRSARDDFESLVSTLILSLKPTSADWCRSIPIHIRSWTELFQSASSLGKNHPVYHVLCMACDIMTLTINHHLEVQIRRWYY